MKWSRTPTGADIVYCNFCKKNVYKLTVHRSTNPLLMDSASVKGINGFDDPVFDGKDRWHCPNCKRMWRIFRLRNKKRKS